MRKAAFTAVIFLIVNLFIEKMAQAQGTVYVSNLGQTTTGSAPIGSDAWIAQGFFTGDNPSGYVLNSVQLQLDATSGSPSGFTVSLYNNHLNGQPYNYLGSLSGSPNPSDAGLFTYTASDLLLSSSSEYLVVVADATPVAQGSYDWSAVSGLTDGIDNWKIFGSYYSSSDDGLSWQTSRQYTFQLAIDATAVPEPSPWILCLAGGGFAFYVHARKRTCGTSR